jgi:hypothetical protein
VRKRATVLAAVAASTPATAAGKHKFPPGCATKPCSDRIGAIWRDHHPRARAASLIAPYRAWLARVARCESSNNTHAVSPGGTYRGLYQFDLQTWASVGGTGDPAQASRDEQDLRAVLLLRRRGASPWPVCG